MNDMTVELGQGSGIIAKISPSSGSRTRLEIPQTSGLGSLMLELVKAAEDKDNAPRTAQILLKIDGKVASKGREDLLAKDSTGTLDRTLAEAIDELSRTGQFEIIAAILKSQLMQNHIDEQVPGLKDLYNKAAVYLQTDPKDSKDRHEYLSSEARQQGYTSFVDWARDVSLLKNAPNGELSLDSLHSIVFAIQDKEKADNIVQKFNDPISGREITQSQAAQMRLA